MKLHKERREYINRSLEDSRIMDDPFTQFDQWFKEAGEEQVMDINNMVISTVGENGRPSSRIVLLKAYSEKGFDFFTNYNSRKGSQLAGNDNVSVLLYWNELDRQIRIEGKAVKLGRNESEDYFNQRPEGSRISAIISDQSQTIQRREELEEAYTSFESSDQKIVCPQHWGGYRIIPDYFEFWQGRENRLHDRIFYSLQNQVWSLGRLAP